jgi:hypothetical protein
VPILLSRVYWTPASNQTKIMTVQPHPNHYRPAGSSWTTPSAEQHNNHPVTPAAACAGTKTHLTGDRERQSGNSKGDHRSRRLTGAAV